MLDSAMVLPPIRATISLVSTIATLAEEDNTLDRGSHRLGLSASADALNKGKELHLIVLLIVG